MNKREKRLLIATIAVLVVGVSSLLLSGDDEPKKKRPQQTVAHAAAGDAGADASPNAEATVWIVDRSAVDSLLARASVPLTELARNPFQRATPVTLPRPTGEPDTAPSDIAVGNLDVSGVFISGSTRGALINGKVWFVGETHGPYHLVSVRDGAVTLSVGNEEWEIIIDRGRIDGEDNASPK